VEENTEVGATRVVDNLQVGLILVTVEGMVDRVKVVKAGTGVVLLKE
jgi:hypothetical protein